MALDSSQKGVKVIRKTQSLGVVIVIGRCEDNQRAMRIVSKF